MEEIRKLETWQEWLEADRLIATAFLHEWDAKKAEERCRAEASGARERRDTTWGLFDGAGRMVSAIVTTPAALTFEGRIVACDELHMVDSLPESRGGGGIRRMMEVVLRAFREKGDPFAVLMPFSFVFYRKFGFELAECALEQEAKIEQFAPFRCALTARWVDSQADADLSRALYERCVLQRNLAGARSDRDWQYRGNGEFGERDWWYGDRTHYTYLFLDEAGAAHAYLTFVFREGKDGPFVGAMEVTDLAFDGPEALRSVFGFIHGMRAKITAVKLSLPRELDLALLLPEGDDVERRLSGHRMARVLNVEKVLGLLRHPQGEGSYRVRVEDRFLPENTGVYEVSYRDGAAARVRRTDGPADLEVTEETFVQLAIGLADLDAALFREGTRLLANGPLLRRVFVRKTL